MHTKRARRRPKNASKDEAQDLQPSISVLMMARFEGGTVQVPGLARTPASSISSGKAEHMKEGSLRVGYGVEVPGGWGDRIQTIRAGRVDGLGERSGPGYGRVSRTSQMKGI